MRCLLLLLLLVPSVLAFPQPEGYVTDTAHLLSIQERAQLEAQLSAIEENTTIEIAVLTIPSLDGAVLEEYATDVFREWGVGKRDVDNGALILIVENTRQIRIEVGYGLEGVLTDAASGLIIRNRLAPAFREQRYYQGLSLAAEDIADLARGEPDAVSAYARAQETNPMRPALLFVVLYGILALSLSGAFRKDKKKKRKAVGASFAGVFALALAYGILVSMAVFVLTFLFMIWITIMALGPAGPLVFIGGRGGGGGFSGGGFGGFGGGMSGGGGASGGW